MFSAVIPVIGNPGGVHACRGVDAIGVVVSEEVPAAHVIGVSLGRELEAGIDGEEGEAVLGSFSVQQTEGRGSGLGELLGARDVGAAGQPASL